MAKKRFKAKTKEEKEKELDELLNKSVERIKKYTSDPKELKELADFMSNIHNYSATNLSLIDQQFKGAKAVASFSDWNKKGFDIKLGEKGISIYAYTPIKTFVNDENENKLVSKATSKEKEKLRKGQYKVTKKNHFSKGTVFDVSQTTATEKDLPKMFPNKVWNFNVEGENNLEDLKKSIDDLSKHLGISIKDMKKSVIGELGNSRGAYVQYVDGSEEILLNSRNSETHSLATSIHELAHAKLHNANRVDLLADKYLKSNVSSIAIKEFEAELTSYIICKKFGMDTSEKAIPYISKWTDNAKDIEPKMMKEIISDVKDTVLDFSKVMDESILKSREEREISLDSDLSDEKTQKNSFNIESEKTDNNEEVKNDDFLINDNNEEKNKKGTSYNLPFYESNKDMRSMVVGTAYYSALVESYKGKYSDLIANDDEKDEDIQSHEIGKNIIMIHHDTNEIELANGYKNGVEKQGDFEIHEWELLRGLGSEENKIKIEEFLIESVYNHQQEVNKELDTEHNQSPVSDTEEKMGIEKISVKDTAPEKEKMETVPTVYQTVVNEVEFLSYGDSDSWLHILDDQLSVKSIDDLNVSSNSEDFYNRRLGEIEETLEEVNKASGKSVLNFQSVGYKDQASVIAYKVNVLKLKDDIERGTFIIPESKNEKKEINLKSLEIE